MKSSPTNTSKSLSEVCCVAATTVDAANSAPSLPPKTASSFSSQHLHRRCVKPGFGTSGVASGWWWGVGSFGSDVGRLVFVLPTS